MSIGIVDRFKVVQINDRNPGIDLILGPMYDFETVAQTFFKSFSIQKPSQLVSFALVQNDQVIAIYFCQAMD